jgi:hypothetical protein
LQDIHIKEEVTLASQQAISCVSRSKHPATASATSSRRTDMPHWTGEPLIDVCMNARALH